MYSLSTTKQFEKDYKLCNKRGFKIALLHTIFELLEKDGTIPLKYKPHRLTGNYKGFWECHIQPDWLLIWEKQEKEKNIQLIRTGTHADLF